MYKDTRNLNPTTNLGSQSDIADSAESRALETLWLDVGNSRIKWLYQEKFGTHRHQGRWAVGVQSILDELYRSDSNVEIENVVVNLREDHPIYSEIRTAVDARIQTTPKVSGLDPAVPRVLPENTTVFLQKNYSRTIGCDRWCAMVAARHRHPGKALLVVDAGSAMTVDCLTRRGEHLGGYIFLGIGEQLSRCFELTRTSRSSGPIADRPFTENTAPAFNTADAIHRAVGLSFKTALADIWRRLREKVGPERDHSFHDDAKRVPEDGPRLVCTGGDGEWVSRYLAPVAGDWQPRLVLEGMRRVGPSSIKTLESAFPNKPER